jgi:hypothetical protein
LTPNWTDRPLYQRINLETTVPPIVSRVFVRWWPSVLKRLPVRIAST